MYDTEQVQYLRKEAELNAVDFNRAALQAVQGGGYVVQLEAPLVDIQSFVEGTIPTRIDARSALQAEGEMLTWLLCIQRAERKRVRLGRVHGWSTADICRVPLSGEELAEYRADIEHRKTVEKLRKELAVVLEAKQDKHAQALAAAALANRYGMTAARHADPAQPNAQAKPVSSRRQRASAGQTQAEE